jgi:ubiquinone/menaquinone biosynthesis C-methylase UbiE
MHGFEDVDSTKDPKVWIDVLDRLRREPFFRELKSRLAAHMGFREGGRYLEIGAGTGADALAARDQNDCVVVGADLSYAMMREACRRGLKTVAVATAESVPFADVTFDGCWSERLFQHLKDPGRVLREMIRVLKPEGNIVAADPDYGTQTIQFPDDDLAQRVLRFRANVGLRNGTIAHRMAQLFHDAGLIDVGVERRTLVVSDAASYDSVFGLRTWARSAMAQDWFTLDEVNRWETLYDESAASGRFRWTVDFFITTGRKWGPV